MNHQHFHGAGTVLRAQPPPRDLPRTLRTPSCFPEEAGEGVIPALGEAESQPEQTSSAGLLDFDSRPPLSTGPLVAPSQYSQMLMRGGALMRGQHWPAGLL